MNLRPWIRAAWRRVRGFGKPSAHQQEYGTADDGETAGQRGERAAERWLRQHGFRVLKRNLRVGDDEADLIARDPDGRTIIIVEVKTRTDADSVPEERIDQRKQFRLARLAANLQRRRGYRDRPLRFDVIAVNLPPHGDPVVRHIPGAFESPF
jgi:putative endonuclease